LLLLLLINDSITTDPVALDFPSISVPRPLSIKQQGAVVQTRSTPFSLLLLALSFAAVLIG